MIISDVDLARSRRAREAPLSSALNRLLVLSKAPLPHLARSGSSMLFLARGYRANDYIGERARERCALSPRPPYIISDVCIAASARAREKPRLFDAGPR